MDRSEVLTLISYEYVKDLNGISHKSEIRKDVFVNVASVGHSEWFAGNREGLNPTYKFTMFGPDYDEQECVEYKGRKYSIYRTYITDNDFLELYVKKESGS